MDRDGLRIIIIEPGSNPRDSAFNIVKDVIDAFCDLNHKVEMIDLKSPVPLEDIIGQFKRFSPDFVFTQNDAGFSPYFLSVMNKLKIPHISWFTRRLDFPETLRRSQSPYDLIFVKDKLDLERLRETNCGRVYLLPLAINSKIFKKMNLSKVDLAKYGCSLAFAGSSYHTWIDYIERYMEKIGNPVLKEMLWEVINVFRQDISGEITSAFQRVEEKFGYSIINKESIIEQFSSAALALYRKELIEEVCNLDIDIYGDKGWERFDLTSGRYRGWVENRTDLPKLYNAAKINLNIALEKSGFNFRFLEILACGGFMLVNYMKGIEDYFEPEKEIACFRNKKELREKIEHYLSHPDKREEIANRGWEKTLKEHTYTVRMQQVIDFVRREFKME